MAYFGSDLLSFFHNTALLSLLWTRTVRGKVTAWETDVLVSYVSIYDKFDALVATTLHEFYISVLSR